MSKQIETTIIIYLVKDASNICYEIISENRKVTKACPTLKQVFEEIELELSKSEKNIKSEP